MAANIHPLADVQSKKIGAGTRIWQFCVVLSGAEIGTNCNVNCNVFIENDVKIGDNVTIKSGVQIWDGIRIEGNVFIGPNATFTNDLTPRSKCYPENFKETIVQEGASLGANVTILAGITIGKFALIGAGSTQTKSVANFTLWFGNPAKHSGYVTRRGDILSIDLKDKQGRQYFLTEEGEPIIKS